MRLEIAPKAGRDLVQIVDELLAYAGSSTAQRWRERFVDKLALIGKLPLAYALRADLGENRRTVTLRPYVIVYTVDEQRILVLRVLHGARDLPQALNE